MGIPLQHNTNMDDPREHLLWGLVGISPSAPLLMPKKIMEDWSEHLHKAGFRHHPELQTIFYRPPGEDASIWDGINGKWEESEVPGESPIGESFDDLDKLLDSLDDRLKDELRRRLGDS